MENNSKQTDFYSYDDNCNLKRVNKCMTELTETEEIDTYEKDKNGNNKIMEMIKKGKGLPKIYQEDKKG